MYETVLQHLVEKIGVLFLFIWDVHSSLTLLSEQHLPNHYLSSFFIRKKNREFDKVPN